MRNTVKLASNASEVLRTVIECGAVVPHNFDDVTCSEIIGNIYVLTHSNGDVTRIDQEEWEQEALSAIYNLEDEELKSYWLNKLKDDGSTMKLVVPEQDHWVITTRRNNRKLSSGENYYYFDDVISFYIPKEYPMKKLGYRSLDWMRQEFN